MRWSLAQDLVSALFAKVAALKTVR